MQLVEWSKFDHGEMSILDSVMALNALFDESDPDIDLPNSLHAFQTAERIRQVHPDLDWFHLTGLIHDAGKLMAIHGEPQVPLEIIKMLDLDLCNLDNRTCQLKVFVKLIKITFGSIII